MGYRSDYTLIQIHEILQNTEQCGMLYLWTNVGKIPKKYPWWDLNHRRVPSASLISREWRMTLYHSAILASHVLAFMFLLVIFNRNWKVFCGICFWYCNYLFDVLQHVFVGSVLFLSHSKHPNTGQVRYWNE